MQPKDRIPTYFPYCNCAISRISRCAEILLHATHCLFRLLQIPLIALIALFQKQGPGVTEHLNNSSCALCCNSDVLLYVRFAKQTANEGQVFYCSRNIFLLFCTLSLRFTVSRTKFTTIFTAAMFIY